MAELALRFGSILDATGTINPNNVEKWCADVTGAVQGLIEGAQDSVGSVFADSTTLDVTYNDGGNAISAEVKDEAITMAKLADITIGSMIIGTTDNRPVAIDVKTDAAILIGNGTTAALQTLDGDVTMNNVGTTVISADAIDLAMLSAGIKPDRIAKYVGHLSWSGSGASLAVSQPGVLSTDYVIATLETAPTQAAYIASAKATADTVTVTLSAANTGNDAVVNYIVMRAAA